MAWQESATIENKNENVGEYYDSIFKELWNFLIGCILVLIAICPILFNILIDSSYKEAFYQIPILFFALFFHVVLLIWLLI